MCAVVRNCLATKTAARAKGERAIIHDQSLTSFADISDAKNHAQIEGL